LLVIVIDLIYSLIGGAGYVPNSNAHYRSSAHRELTRGLRDFVIAAVFIQSENGSGSGIAAALANKKHDFGDKMRLSKHWLFILCVLGFAALRGCASPGQVQGEDGFGPAMHKQDTERSAYPRS
jgi:hypothetical protein